MMMSYANTMIKHKKMLITFLTLLLISYTMDQKNHILSEETTTTTTTTIIQKGSSRIHLFSSLKLHGELDFDNVTHAAKDFGNRVHLTPSAVLYPKSVSDISSIIKLGAAFLITVAAKGHSHSLEGQAQSNGGVVINMESLKKEMVFYKGGEDQGPYVDVSGGELWIDVLDESLKHGLSPKSWTDYLHLSVGGTLSNAGVSGQAFKHGPQINNVYQLEVVTGTGEVFNCSDEENSDLFHSVLGGLGQFGIITKARIALEPAPKMAKWIRVLYSDFSTFSLDQELLISSETTFDYIEGFVIINRTGLLNNWRYFFNPKDPLEASKFKSEGKVLFCLEVVKYFNPNDKEHLDQDVDAVLSKLNFIRSTRFESEVPYVQFLDRVHASELELKEKGLWDVPHPWLNLLVPKTKIHEFSDQVFKKILTVTSNGPIIIYPVNQSTWRNGTSMITPDEPVFYLVTFLSSAMPDSTGMDGLEYILDKNRRILQFCAERKLGVKQYLPHYGTREEWKGHFGEKWEVFNRRKYVYDPLAILAPGQRIFEKGVAFE